MAVRPVLKPEMKTELEYHYDIFDKSEFHCRDCQFLVGKYNFQPFCELTGTTIQRQGYCNYFCKEVIE